MYSPFEPYPIGSGTGISKYNSLVRNEKTGIPSISLYCDSESETESSKASWSSGALTVPCIDESRARELLNRADAAQSVGMLLEGLDYRRSRHREYETFADIEVERWRMRRMKC